MGHPNYNQITATMIPKIKDIAFLPDFHLKVFFDDGTGVLYDVNEDIESVDEFKGLKSIYGLWNQGKVDSSRTIVYWNDRIDLPSDMIYEYGKPIER